MNENELKHFGILKQKWGVRNGPPYPLDREDYSPEEKRANPVKKSERSAKREQKKTVNRRHTLTKEELQLEIEKIKLQKQLKELSDEDLAPGKKFVKDVLKDSGSKVLKAAVVAGMAAGTKWAINKIYENKKGKYSGKLVGKAADALKSNDFEKYFNDVLKPKK